MSALKSEAFFGEAAREPGQIAAALREKFEKMLKKIENVKFYFDNRANPEASAYALSMVDNPKTFFDGIFLTTDPALNSDQYLTYTLLHEVAHVGTGASDHYYISTDAGEIKRRPPEGKQLPPWSFDMAMDTADVLAHAAVLVASNKSPLSPPSFGTTYGKIDEGPDAGWTYYIDRPIPSLIRVYLPLYRIDEHGKQQQRPSIDPPEIIGFQLISPDPVERTADYVKYAYVKTDS